MIQIYGKKLTVHLYDYYHSPSMTISQVYLQKLDSSFEFFFNSNQIKFPIFPSFNLKSDFLAMRKHLKFCLSPSLLMLVGIKRFKIKEWLSLENAFFFLNHCPSYLLDNLIVIWSHLLFKQFSWHKIMFVNAFHLNVVKPSQRRYRDKEYVEA